MANKQEVITLFRKNPTWNSVMIADALGCESSYVRATLKRNGLSLIKRLGPVVRERERCAALAKKMGRADIAAEILKEGSHAGS